MKVVRKGGSTRFGIKKLETHSIFRSATSKNPLPSLSLCFFHYKIKKIKIQVQFGLLFLFSLSRVFTKHDLFVEPKIFISTARILASFILFLFMVLFRRILLHWVSFQSNYQFCSLEAIAPGWAWPRKAKSVFVFGLLIRLEELFIKHLLTKIIALLLKPTLRNVLSESSAYTENPSVSCG